MECAQSHPQGNCLLEQRHKGKLPRTAPEETRHMLLGPLPVQPGMRDNICEVLSTIEAFQRLGAQGFSWEQVMTSCLSSIHHYHPRFSNEKQVFSTNYIAHTVRHTPPSRGSFTEVKLYARQVPYTQAFLRQPSQICCICSTLYTLTSTNRVASSITRQT